MLDGEGWLGRKLDVSLLQIMFVNRPLTQIQRFPRSQAPAWECLPSSSA